MSRVRVTVEGIVVRQLFGTVFTLDGLRLKSAIVGMFLVATQNLLVRVVVGAGGAHHPV